MNKKKRRKRQQTHYIDFETLITVRANMLEVDANFLMGALNCFIQLLELSFNELGLALFILFSFLFSLYCYLFFFYFFFP
jgi:hypothetical protein